MKGIGFWSKIKQMLGSSGMEPWGIGLEEHGVKNQHSHMISKLKAVSITTRSYTCTYKFLIFNPYHGWIMTRVTKENQIVLHGKIN